MGLSNSEINSIISVENSWLTSTAIIYRAGTATPDGIGGFSDNYSSIGTVDCDLWERFTRADETTQSANQQLSISEWFITVPYDTDIKSSDYVVIEGKSFDIVSVPNKQSINTALRCRVISRNEMNQI